MMYLFLQEYKTALSFFRRVLTLDPYHPFNVRVCLGHCFWKLNQKEKARVAFERAVEVSPDDVNALSALGVWHLNTMNQNSILKGIKLLADAYLRDSNHLVSIIYLADHYYYKRDFEKSLELSERVFQTSEVNELRNLSAFIIGRIYQTKVCLSFDGFFLLSSAFYD